MPNCPVCGKTLVEAIATTLKCPAPDQHAFGEPKVCSATLGCSVKKGAIWVYVTDDSGRGLGMIPVTVAKAPVPGPKPTDPIGFASFDPLDPGEYTVKFAIPPEKLDDFYPPRRTEITNVPVRNGEVTSVEFRLERTAPLKVSVQYPPGFPGKLGILVGASSQEFNPAFPMTEGLGFLTFPKLRRHNYTVKFKLTEEQKKLHAIEGDRSKPWSHDPYGDNEVAFKVIAMKLIRLEVIGTHDLTGGHSWCVADAVRKVRVKAITEPNDKRAWSQLKWEGAAPDGDNSEALVNITDTGDFIVKASLDAPQSVTIEVYDILTVDCPLPKKLTASKWKAYVSNAVTRMKVTTKPDEERVWKHLTWSEGTPRRSKNQCNVVLTPKGDRTVTAFLDGKPAEGILHICQWPRVEIEEVTFGGGHTVLNDGVVGIGQAFPFNWIKGRQEFAPNVATDQCQPPICFTMNTPIKLAAKFKVLEYPTEDETITVRATGDFGEVKADIVVHPAGAPGEMPEMESSDLLLDHVDCVDAWKIDWEHTLEDGAWAPANSSTHLLYLTLADPLVDIYFTLLDISCRGAALLDTEEDVAEYSFLPFKSHTGDNNGFPRKGDGVKLSYYLQGIKTSGGDDAQTTQGILGSPHGTGRCGGWATMLIHMWKMHGINTATRRWYIRAATRPDYNTRRRFLVKNCDFSGGADFVGLYSSKGREAIKLDGVGGQGKTNPQFDFGDHVVVKFDNKLYDPSYGMDGYDTDASYLTAALAGVANAADLEDFSMADGTPQFISTECAPYVDGLATYRIAFRSLQSIANLYGQTADALLASDPALSAICATSADVWPGDIIAIPVAADGSFDLFGSYVQRVMIGEVTLDMIAAAHDVTEQAILDDPANTGLKALRVTTAGIMDGDIIHVTRASAPNSNWWVTGHDI